MKIPVAPIAEPVSGRLSVVQGTRGTVFSEMERLGAVTMALAGRWQQELDHDALVEAQNRYAGSMAEWMSAATEQRQGGDARGVTRDFRARHQQLVADIGGAEGMSPEARKAFSAWASGREAQGLREVVQHEHRQLKLYGKDQHDLRVQGAFNEVERNPTQWRDAARQLEEGFTLAVGQGVYRPEEAKARLGLAQDKLRVTAFDNLYAMDRDRALAEMGDLGLSEEQQARARKRYEADREHERRIAEERANEAARQLTLEAGDAEYMALHGGETAALRDLAGRFAALGKGRTAETLLRKAELYENNYAAGQDARTRPLPELARAITDIDGKLSDTRDPTAWRTLAEEREVRARIYDARLGLFRKDPAAAVADLAGGETPEGQAESRLALQESNGLPAGARRVLTGDEAATLAGKWAEGDATTRIALWQDVLLPYGRHAGKAAAEAGITPAEQVAVTAAMADPRNVANLKAVVTAAAAKPEELPALDKAKELTREAVETSAVYRAYATAARKAMPGNASIQNGLRQMEKTLGNLVRMNGGDAEAAARALDGTFQPLVDGRFSLVFDPGKASGRDMERGLEAALGPRLEEFLRDRRYRDDFDRADHLAFLRRDAVWVNAPDGEGFVLVDPVAQAPVADARGNMFRLTAGEVLELAREMREGAGREAAGREPDGLPSRSD